MSISELLEKQRRKVSTRKLAIASDKHATVLTYNSSIAKTTLSDANKRSRDDDLSIQPVAPREPPIVDTIWDAAARNDAEAVIRLVRGGARLKLAIIDAMVYGHVDLIRRLGLTFNHRLVNEPTEDNPAPRNQKWDDEHFINRMFFWSEDIRENFADVYSAFPHFLDDQRIGKSWKLVRMIRRGSLEEIREFIQRNPSLPRGREGSEFGSPFDAAIKYNRLDVVQVAIEYGFADTADEDQETALEYIIRHSRNFDLSQLRRIIDALLSRNIGFSTENELQLLAALDLDFDESYREHIITIALQNSSNEAWNAVFRAISYEELSSANSKLLFRAIAKAIENRHDV